MFKQLLLALAIAFTTSLMSGMPELVKHSYHGVARNVVNVTVGEQFSLPLPMFDSPWNS
jgi:hypothetical protein